MKNELKIKPYDEKLSKNVADLVVKIIKKHKTDFKSIEQDIIKLVDRKIVLYKDYEEDVKKAFARGREFKSFRVSTNEQGNIIFIKPKSPYEYKHTKELKWGRGRIWIEVVLGK